LPDVLYVQSGREVDALDEVAPVAVFERVEVVGAETEVQWIIARDREHRGDYSVEGATSQELLPLRLLSRSFSFYKHFSDS